jgi:hypothetical protein
VVYEPYAGSLDRVAFKNVSESMYANAQVWLDSMPKDRSMLEGYSEPLPRRLICRLNVWFVPRCQSDGADEDNL